MNKKDLKDANKAGTKSQKLKNKKQKKNGTGDANENYLNDA